MAAPASALPEVSEAPAAEKPRRATTRRKAAGTDMPATEAAEAPAAEKPPRATTRRKAAGTDAAVAPVAAEAPAAEAPTAEEAAPDHPPQGCQHDGEHQHRRGLNP